MLNLNVKFIFIYLYKKHTCYARRHLYMKNILCCTYSKTTSLLKLTRKLALLIHSYFLI